MFEQLDTKDSMSWQNYHTILSKTKVKVLVTQSYPTLCHQMACSLLGSSVHGIFQGRMLEWLAIPFIRGFLISGIEPESPVLQADSFLSKPPG